MPYTGTEAEICLRSFFRLSIQFDWKVCCMAETLLAILLVTASAKGTNLVFHWPAFPSSQPRLARPKPPQGESASQIDHVWLSASGTDVAANNGSGSHHHNNSNSAGAGVDPNANGGNNARYSAAVFEEDYGVDDWDWDYEWKRPNAYRSERAGAGARATSFAAESSRPGSRRASPFKNDASRRRRSYSVAVDPDMSARSGSGMSAMSAS